MICPLRMKEGVTNGGTFSWEAELLLVKDFCRCVESECAWWVTPYTTEGRSAGGMCALAAIALKNAEGHYVV